MNVEEEYLMTEEGAPLDEGPAPVTLDVILACLKRIRESVQRRNKEGGRQGYLTFIGRFIH